MSKTRFTPWVVLACIATLAGCTSGEDGTVGNTEVNVMIPTGGGSSAPAAFDIQVVEYTINCDATPPTASDFPGIDGIQPGADTYDPDVTINGVLEVLDTAVTGPIPSPDGFGPVLAEAYIWQGFMDIPLEAVCTAQLRARDADGEVICTATEPFDTNTVAVGGTVKVNVLMYCGVSFQAPVANLDLDGDFTFNIANFCPDVFVLNCIDSELNVRTIPGIGEVLATACQVRFRDGDSQCGGDGNPLPSSCDPQDCVTTPQGLDCAPRAGFVDPPVTTTVVCSSPSGTCAISCDGFNPAASCTFTGDTLGDIGDPPPGALQPGIGGFFVSCATFDDDGDPSTPEVPLAPGADITCTSTTTDGDTDCNKIKVVDLTIEGLTACGNFFAGGGTCSDGNDCTDDVCTDAGCDGTQANCCSNPNSPAGGACTDAAGFGGTCDGAGTCVSADCRAQTDPDGFCQDGSVCTLNTCDTTDGSCTSTNTNEGGACASGTGSGDGSCVTGTCTSNDECLVDGQCPDPGVSCQVALCDTGVTPYACGSQNAPAGTSCDAGGGAGTGSCDAAGVCVAGCTVPGPVDRLGIPMACRNTFNQAVSTFPIDLENVTPDDCVQAGSPVNFDIDPTIALDTAFLQAAADTLCATGLALTQADVGQAQISIDAIAGATCTEQLTELTPVPQTVLLDVTVVGTCGSGGTITVNSGISLPLPAVRLPCTAGSAGSEVQICSTGEIPLVIDLGTPDANETYVNVVVGGGFITVAFKCNTSSTTEPAPGTTVDCTAPNPAGECAGLPAGDVGETPFPVSDCDFADGFPGSCTTVPVGVDPGVVCPTFTVTP